MKYHCNYCYTTDIQEGDMMYKKFFKTNVKTDFIRHLKSPKHSKQLEAIKCIPVENKVKCSGCDKWMELDAYREHRKRNEKYLVYITSDPSKKTMVKYHKAFAYFPVFEDWPCSCDDYTYKNKRFPSCDDFLRYIEKREKYNLDFNKL